MEVNTTCGGYCVTNALNKTEWCHQWRPPPFPEDLTEYREELVLLLKNDEGFKLYSDVCEVEIPRILTSTTTTIPTTTLPVSEISTIPFWNNSSLPFSEDSSVSVWKTSTLPITENSTTPISNTTSAATIVPTTVTTITPLLTTTTVQTTASKLAQEQVHTAGGTIAGIVIVVVLVFILVIATLMCYLFKRKKKRTGRINSLPLKEYENTNYLDNKARGNHSWNPSLNHHASDANSVPVSKSNDYGSLPPHPVLTNDAQYVKRRSINSSETRVESPREFDKMNASGLPEKLVYDNESFMNDREQNGAVSPGATSQTPLFDMIDGPVLPNVVPDCQTVSENSIRNGDEIHQNGSLGKIPEGKLPPIDMTVTKRKTSDSSAKSPKKKKPLYLQRKSVPIDGLEDITQDMSGNRKSV